MKTREVIAVSLFGLALLTGCNKGEEPTTPATGSSSETAPAESAPAPETTPAPTESAPAEPAPAEPAPAAPAPEGQ